jgi:MSHA biogenesis protein MshE
MVFQRLKALKIDPGSVQCKDADGCSQCGLRGYVGRTGLYELLELNPDMVAALRMSDVAAFAKAARACETYKPLILSALDLVKDGITSINEAMRVVGQSDAES